MKTMGCEAKQQTRSWRAMSVLVLMFPAVVSMGMGCAGDEPLTEQLATVSSAAASGCGALRSGEQLRKGESVQSCNGMANLVHQTDGNVVLYDSSGALWSSATYGRPTSHLVMQSDGNLVLYDTSGQAVWYTGTHGNTGASLAIQNDCNLVIYSTTGRVLWTSATQCRSAPPSNDLLPYFKNTRSPTLLGSDGSIVGFSQTADGKTWWYRKWSGSTASNKFEKYTYDANYVYLTRDTTWSWKASNGTVYDSYDPIGLSFPLAKRNWPATEAFQFLSTLKPFNVNTCSASTERPQHGWYRTIKYYPNYCWGNGTNGNIGCVDSVAVSSAFLDNTRQPREVHWYAKNLGWVRYEEYDAAGNRTKDIYWTTMSSTSYPVSDVCQ